jgi:hypothetical protein
MMAAGVPCIEGYQGTDQTAQHLAEQVAHRLGQLVAEAEQALAAAAQMQRAASKELPDFWSFQTCAEFGGYMTCDVGSRCFFSQGLLTLPMLMSFCPDSFNITTDAVTSNVAATNLRYGGSAPAVTCAVFANGEIDPFSPMGVLEPSLDRDLYAFLVPGKPFESSTAARSATACRTAVVELSVQVRATTLGHTPPRLATRAA